jgi:hypothetical protein
MSSGLWLNTEFDATVIVENAAFPAELRGGKEAKILELIKVEKRRLSGKLDFSPVVVRNMTGMTAGGHEFRDWETAEDISGAGRPAEARRPGSSAKSGNVGNVKNSANAENAGNIRSSGNAGNAGNLGGIDGLGDEVIEIPFDSAGFRNYSGKIDFTLSNEFGIGMGKIVDRIAAKL